MNRMGIIATAFALLALFPCARPALAEAAPDGSPAADKPYEVKEAIGSFGVQGTIAVWFKPTRTLRGNGSPIDLVQSDAFSIQIAPRRDAVHVLVQSGPAMTGRRDGAEGKPFAHPVLLTHLNADQWYHAAWTWDCGDARCVGFYLDGILQGDPSSYEYDRQLVPAASAVLARVGGDGIVVGRLVVNSGVFDGNSWPKVNGAAKHRRYVDEGLRYSGTEYHPKDVAFENPVYETSFDEDAVLRDWRLEGGRRMSVQGGNLVLESDTKSLKSEADANHLVCWLTKEVPAGFLLEFTVRPQNRQRGLNIVFFNARGLNGENIFKPPIRPRDGLFSQYHSGDLNNYHISYWSGGRGTSNLRKNKGFYLTAIGKDLIYTAPNDSFQTVRVYKRGGRIRLMVDDMVALQYDDDGTTYGPIHTHSGWIGLRQMGHTHRCEYGHVKVWPLK